ncbi:MAG: PAS domain-containing sensor histidine kinase [Opitutaceae bacterium]|nr:PAS domain-containing sensor histidine kinase [Cytophagales bacterium]
MAIEKMLFDYSSIPMLVIKNKTHITKINKAFIFITGIDLIPGSNAFQQFVHEDDILPARMLLENDLNIEQTLRWKFKEGKFKSLKFKVEKRSKNETLFSVEDYEIVNSTESKKFVNEQVLHLILDLVPYPVFVKNSKSEYILLNQAQADLFGLTINEMLGKTDGYFIKKKEELDLVRKSDRKAFSSLEKVVLAEQNFSTPNGKNYVLQTIKVPFINVVTSEKNLLGVSIDYTEKKIVQDELMKTNFELDNFVYRASHDLKAPLRSVMGLVSLMKMDNSQANRDSCIDKIETSIFKLNVFIKELTDYSRNERLEVQYQKLDLEESLYRILESLKYLDPVKKVNVGVNIQSSHPFASDKHRIDVILQNILSNSIKYQKPENKHPFINIAGVINENEAIIEISDNGIGIKQEYQEGVFKMFYRATELSEGSGLGLYIVKQSIEKLEGQISFKSEENSGTTFKLHFKNLHSRT